MDQVKFGLKLKDTLSKPISKSTLSKDLPRIVHNFELYKWNSEENTFEGIPLEQTEEQKTDLLQLMKLISENMNKPLNEDQIKEYNEKVDFDDHKTLTNYLLETIGEEEGLCRILKACPQGIVVGVMLFTKPGLKMKYNVQFKDAKIKNPWTIQIYFKENESYLVHKRVEQIFENQEKHLIKEFGVWKDICHFRWELKLNFELNTGKYNFIKVHLDNLETDNEVYIQKYKEPIESFYFAEIPIKEEEPEPKEEEETKQESIIEKESQMEKINEQPKDNSPVKDEEKHQESTPKLSSIEKINEQNDTVEIKETEKKETDENKNAFETNKEEVLKIEEDTKDEQVTKEVVAQDEEEKPLSKEEEEELERKQKEEEELEKRKKKEAEEKKKEAFLATEQGIDSVKFKKKLEETFEKTLTKSSLSKDLPRILQNFEFFKWKNEKFEEISFVKSESKEETLLSLFQIISNEIGQPLEESTIENYKKNVDLDSHQTLNDFLIEYGEYKALTNILKSCSQSIVISTMLFTKPGLKMKYNVQFKDAKIQNPWRIQIYFKENDYCLVHKRVEQIFENQEKHLIKELGAWKDICQFEWEMKLNFKVNSGLYYNAQMILNRFIGENQQDVERYRRIIEAFYNKTNVELEIVQPEIELSIIEEPKPNQTIENPIEPQKDIGKSESIEESKPIEDSSEIKKSILDTNKLAPINDEEQPISPRNRSNAKMKVEAKNINYSWKKDEDYFYLNLNEDSTFKSGFFEKESKKVTECVGNYEIENGKIKFIMNKEKSEIKENIETTYSEEKIAVLYGSGSGSGIYVWNDESIMAINDELNKNENDETREDIEPIVEKKSMEKNPSIEIKNQISLNLKKINDTANNKVQNRLKFYEDLKSPKGSPSNSNVTSTKSGSNSNLTSPKEKTTEKRLSEGSNRAIEKFKLNLAKSGELTPNNVPFSPRVHDISVKYSAGKELKRNEYCEYCKKKVYVQERIEVSEKIYHHYCFKCSKCKKRLHLGNFKSYKNEIYCANHYKDIIYHK
eukprot:gene3475-6124_t